MDSIQLELTELEGSVHRLERYNQKLGTPMDNAALRARAEEERKAGRVLAKNIHAAIEQNSQSAVAQSVLPDFQALAARLFAASETYMNAVNANAGGAAGAGGGPGRRQGQQRQQQQQKLRQDDVDAKLYDVRVMERRLDDAREIKSELNQIKSDMDQLNALVNEQQDNINQIEGDVETATSNIVAGEGQLDEADTLQQAARKKKCLLFFLILVALGLIVLFIYLVSKK